MLPSPDGAGGSRVIVALTEGGASDPCILPRAMPSRRAARARGWTSSAIGRLKCRENLRLLAKYSAAMESGDSEAVFEFFAPDFRSHVTTRVTPDRVDEDIRGEEQRWWEQARSAFPDMTFTVDLLVESDDLVVSNWTVRGTPRPPSMTYPPSGRPVTINGTAILRISDGQITEHWGGPTARARSDR